VDSSDVAPVIVGVTFMLMVAGVILLRPITKRLGDLLELLILERRRQSAAPLPRLGETLERMEERLRLLEERQDFTDSLVHGRAKPRALSAAEDTSDHA
jgi:hypothetical protein